MSTSKKVTIIVLVLVTAGLIVWDICAAVEPTKGDTISEVILSWARTIKTLPLAFGVLCGHFFWPWSYPDGWKKKSIPALIGIGVLSLVGDILGCSAYAPMAIVLLIGITFGHFLWPQAERTL